MTLQSCMHLAPLTDLGAGAETEKLLANPDPGISAAPTPTNKWVAQHPSHTLHLRDKAFPLQGSHPLEHAC